MTTLLSEALFGELVGPIEWRRESIDRDLDWAADTAADALVEPLQSLYEQELIDGFRRIRIRPEEPAVATTRDRADHHGGGSSSAIREHRFDHLGCVCR